jgi:hypothetical protein
MENKIMDKWDELVNRVKQGILAEEPEAALAGSLQLLAEIGRTFEQLGADVDRIATVLEAREVTVTGESAPILDL